ncbi:MAG: hypothetical protein Q7S27_03890 [Nanoarchaeota archaeon]|nr:hypothetical protein [Nanoarchaeota archaeon]
MNIIPKKWRELPIKEKLDIPRKYFKIDENILEKIRRIENPKEKLIAAARIQYELFNNIHSYLTVWIAGYSSDIAVREYFGSTKNLRDLFIRPIIYDEKIKPSWADIKRNLKIPDKMTEDLAEEIGIHIGDGSLYSHIDKRGWGNYRYTVSGDLTNEYLYHKEYIGKLMRKLYNIGPLLLERKDKNNIDSRYKSKALAEFKNKILGLPYGSKKDIIIPSSILKNNAFQKRCVVGIIDTDFHITSSLSISGKLHSLLVAKQMHEILDANQIKHIFRIYENYARFYIGKNEAFKIYHQWGLHNEKHITKFKIFEKFKKFIPFTTTPERLALLDGKLDVVKLEKISMERREGDKIPSLVSYK